MMADTGTDFGGKKTRAFKYGANVVVAGVAFIVVLFAINFFASRAQRRIDLTKDKQFTISESTNKLLAGLKDNVIITVYATEQGTPANWTEQREELRNLLQEYRRKSNRLVKYDFVDPNTKAENEKKARDAGMKAVAMQQASLDEYSIKEGYLGFAVTYGPNTEKIPYITPQSSVEYQLTRAISKVAQVDKPVVGIVAPQGNPFMGDQGNYQMLPEILKQEGYEVKTLEAANLKDLKGIQLLMLFDPQDLSEEVLYHIDQFVMNGGKMFVAASGVQMDPRMGRATPKAPNVNSLLENYGMRINEDILEDWGRALTQQVLTPRGFVNSKNPFIQLTTDLSTTSPITKDLRQMIYIMPSSVSRSDQASSIPVQIEVLAQTSGQTKKQEQYFMMDQTKLQRPAKGEGTTYSLMLLAKGPMPSRFANVPPPTLTEDGGTTRSVNQNEVKTQSSPEARVIATGSTMSFVDDIISRPDAQLNAIFLLNVADALTREGSMIALRSKHTEMAPLQSNIARSKIIWAHVLAIGGVPIALIAFGFFMMLRNSRKRARYSAMYGTARKVAD